MLCVLLALLSLPSFSLSRLDAEEEEDEVPKLLLF